MSGRQVLLRASRELGKGTPSAEAARAARRLALRRERHPAAETSSAPSERLSAPPRHPQQGRQLRGCRAISSPAGTRLRRSKFRVVDRRRARARRIVVGGRFPPSGSGELGFRTPLAAERRPPWAYWLVVVLSLGRLFAKITTTAEDRPRRRPRLAGAHQAPPQGRLSFRRESRAMS